MQEQQLKQKEGEKELVDLEQEFCGHNSEVTNLVLMTIQWYALVTLSNCQRAENKGVK